MREVKITQLSQALVATVEFFDRVSAAVISELLFWCIENRTVYPQLWRRTKSDCMTRRSRCIWLGDQPSMLPTFQSQQMTRSCETYLARCVNIINTVCIDIIDTLLNSTEPSSISDGQVRNSKLRADSAMSSLLCQLVSIILKVLSSINVAFLGSGAKISWTSWARTGT